MIKPRLKNLFPIILVVSFLSADIIHIPGDYGTIQEGADSASAGDTLLIDPGIYYEHILFSKTLSIFGSGEEETIVVSDTTVFPAIMIENTDIFHLNNLTASGKDTIVTIQDSTCQKGGVAMMIDNCSFIFIDSVSITGGDGSDGIDDTWPLLILDGGSGGEGMIVLNSENITARYSLITSGHNGSPGQWGYGYGGFGPRTTALIIDNCNFIEFLTCQIEGKYSGGPGVTISRISSNVSLGSCTVSDGEGNEGLGGCTFSTDPRSGGRGIEIFSNSELSISNTYFMAGT